MRGLREDGLNTTESNLYLAELIAKLMQKEEIIKQLKTEAMDILNKICEYVNTNSTEPTEDN